MASGKYNTMEEGLLKIAQELTTLQTAADVGPEDMAWLVEKQTEFIQRARRGVDGESALPPPGGPSNDLAPPGPPPPELAALLGGGGGIPMGGGPPPMPPGAGPMPAPPRPGPTDMGEIQRMLG